MQESTIDLHSFLMRVYKNSSYIEMNMRAFVDYDLHQVNNAMLVL
jgi:hypothetical protein